MRRLFLGVLCLVACQQAPAKMDESRSEDETVLQQFLDLNARLERIAYPILKANLSECPQVQDNLGVFVHTIHDFPEDMRAIVRDKLGLNDNPSIRHVLPGSPAKMAGLTAGDKILAINDVNMIEGGQARLFFETVGRSEFSKGQVSIKINRAGHIETVILSPEKICSYSVQLLFSGDLNAYTNGDDIWVTTELVNRLSSEESLALVIAHELAHATEGHIFKSPTREFELQADRIGMAFLIKAGYDGDLALAEWTNNPLNHKSLIGESHPTFEDRWRELDSALQAAKNPSDVR